MHQLYFWSAAITNFLNCMNLIRSGLCRLFDHVSSGMLNIAPVAAGLFTCATLWPCFKPSWVQGQFDIFTVHWNCWDSLCLIQHKYSLLENDPSLTLDLVSAYSPWKHSVTDMILKASIRINEFFSFFLFYLQMKNCFPTWTDLFFFRTKKNIFHLFLFFFLTFWNALMHLWAWIQTHAVLPKHYSDPLRFILNSNADPRVSKDGEHVWMNLE